MTGIGTAQQVPFRRKGWRSALITVVITALTSAGMAAISTSGAQAATAATVGCSWCLDFGYYLAHSEGMDLEKIREVMRWRDSDVFSPVEREVLGYAEAMSTTPPRPARPAPMTAPLLSMKSWTSWITSSMTPTTKLAFAHACSRSDGSAARRAASATGSRPS